MTKPKKAVDPSAAPVFTGALAEPVSGVPLTVAILRSRHKGPEGQHDIDEANAAMWAECLGKLPLLAAHYDVEWRDAETDWSRLVLAMALDFVPGFKFKFPETYAPPKPGRPAERNWTSLFYRASRLMDQGMRLTDACRRLSLSDPDFQGLKPTTLVSKFNEAKQAVVKAASEAIMSESDEVGKPTDIPKTN